MAEVVANLNTAHLSPQIGLAVALFFAAVWVVPSILAIQLVHAQLEKDRVGLAQSLAWVLVPGAVPRLLDMILFHVQPRQLMEEEIVYMAAIMIPWLLSLIWVGRYLSDWLVALTVNGCVAFSPWLACVYLLGPIHWTYNTMVIEQFCSLFGYLFFVAGMVVVLLWFPAQTFGQRAAGFGAGAALWIVSTGISTLLPNCLDAAALPISQTEMPFVITNGLQYRYGHFGHSYKVDFAPANPLPPNEVIRIDSVRLWVQFSDGTRQPLEIPDLLNASQNSMSRIVRVNEELLQRILADTGCVVRLIVLGRQIRAQPFIGLKALGTASFQGADWYETDQQYSLSHYSGTVPAHSQYSFRITGYVRRALQQGVDFQVLVNVPVDHWPDSYSLPESDSLGGGGMVSPIILHDPDDGLPSGHFWDDSVLAGRTERFVPWYFGHSLNNQMRPVPPPPVSDRAIVYLYHEYWSPFQGTATHAVSHTHSSP